MIVAYSLYLVARLAVCLTVSVVASTSRAALGILLVCWTANAVLAPRLASDFAQRILPTPKLAELETELNKELQEAGVRGHHAGGPWIKALERRTLAEYDKTRIQDLPFNFQGLKMLEAERIAGGIYDKHYGRLWDQLESQDRVVGWSGLLAPLLGLRSASMALAGTDFTHHRGFSVAAEEHRREFVRVLNEHMMHNSRGGGVAGRELWEKLPPFRYEQPATAVALRTAAPGLIVLGLWVLGAWAALLLVAPRLKPS
jgi:ABC-2 type transport system permease protein